MSKYIDADKLIAEIKGLQCEQGFDTGEAKRAYQFAIKDILAFIESLQQEQPEGNLEYWLEHFGMPKENIDNCITQIAQGYGACRYLEGIQHGAEAVNELAKQEQPEVDLEKITNIARIKELPDGFDKEWMMFYHTDKEYNSAKFFHLSLTEREYIIARHFYELGKCKKGGNEMNAPILDACCGGRMFYFDKEDDRVLFQDIRDEEIELTKGGIFTVRPDVIADFRNMPYPDNSFRMVVFDPPHMVYYSRDETASHERRGDLYAEYGELKKDWREYLSQGFKECFRVLKPGGFLIFKWSETDIKVKAILALTPERPVFGHKSGKAMGTHWICFMKSEKI